MASASEGQLLPRSDQPTRYQVANDPATDVPDFDVSFLGPVHVAAFAADGTLIAENGVPWGGVRASTTGVSEAPVTRGS